MNHGKAEMKMTLTDRLKKAIKAFMKNEVAHDNNIERTKENYYVTKEQFQNRFNKLEKEISRLSALSQNIRDLDERITNLTTSHEELLYALDSGEISAQDNEGGDVIDFSMKKYGLN